MGNRTASAADTDRQEADIPVLLDHCSKRRTPLSFDAGAVDRMSGTFSRLSESTKSARLTELSENNFSREVATRMADSLLCLRGFGWRVGLSALLLLCRATQGSSFEQDIDSSAVSVLHVQGVVLNALTNKPISRVLVTAMDAATMTDSDGRFVFDDVPRGFAQFVLRSPGERPPVVTPSIEL